MALNIKIDFHNVYPVRFIDTLNYSVFDTELVDGTSISLGVKISAKEHPLMADVYNLAFGPMNRFNLIDDQIKLMHKDHSKVFSTIVFEGLSFLAEYPDKFLGIDGSNTARAYDDVHDYENEDFLTIPTPIKKGQTLKITRLYNYFIFKMK